MDPTTIEPLTQFGPAGLLGALWLAERWLSRRRETQLTEAHERLVTQKHELDALLLLVKQNTAAIERFEQTQQRLLQLLEKHHDALAA